MPLRDPPPFPGALPLGSKVLVWRDGAERKGEILAASAQHGEPRAFVAYEEGGRRVVSWVPRSEVRAAPPTRWERWQPHLRKLTRRIKRGRR